MAAGEDPAQKASKRKDELEGMSPYARALAEAGPYLNIGTVFAASIGAFAWIGWRLDVKFGTDQRFLLGGALFGVFIGFLNFFKVVLNLNRRKGK